MPENKVQDNTTQQQSNIGLFKNSNNNVKVPLQISENKEEKVIDFGGLGVDLKTTPAPAVNIKSPVELSRETRTHYLKVGADFYVVNGKDFQDFYNKNKKYFDNNLVEEFNSPFEYYLKYDSNFKQVYNLGLKTLEERKIEFNKKMNVEYVGELGKRVKAFNAEMTVGADRYVKKIYGFNFSDIYAFINGLNKYYENKFATVKDINQYNALVNEYKTIKSSIPDLFPGTEIHIINGKEEIVNKKLDKLYDKFYKENRDIIADKHKLKITSEGKFDFRPTFLESLREQFRAQLYDFASSIAFLAERTPFWSYTAQYGAAPKINVNSLVKNDELLFLAVDRNYIDKSLLESGMFTPKDIYNAYAKVLSEDIELRKKYLPEQFKQLNYVDPEMLSKSTEFKLKSIQHATEARFKNQGIHPLDVPRDIMLQLMNIPVYITGLPGLISIGTQTSLSSAKERQIEKIMTGEGSELDFVDYMRSVAYGTAETMFELVVPRSTFNIVRKAFGASVKDLPLDNMIKNIARTKTEKILSRFGENIATGLQSGIEEMLTNIAQQTTDYLAYKKNIDINQVLYSGVVGYGAGRVFQTLGNIYQSSHPFVKSFKAYGQEFLKQAFPEANPKIINENVIGLTSVYSVGKILQENFKSESITLNKNDISNNSIVRLFVDETKRVLGDNSDFISEKDNSLTINLNNIFNAIYSKAGIENLNIQDSRYLSDRDKQFLSDENIEKDINYIIETFEQKVKDENAVFLAAKKDAVIDAIKDLHSKKEINPKDEAYYGSNGVAFVNDKEVRKVTVDKGEIEVYQRAKESGKEFDNLPAIDNIVVYKKGDNKVFYVKRKSYGILNKMFPKFAKGFGKINSSYYENNTVMDEVVGYFSGFKSDVMDKAKELKKNKELSVEEKVRLLNEYVKNAAVEVVKKVNEKAEALKTEIENLKEKRARNEKLTDKEAAILDFFDDIVKMNKNNDKIEKIENLSLDANTVNSQALEGLAANNAIFRLNDFFLKSALDLAELGLMSQDIGTVDNYGVDPETGQIKFIDPSKPFVLGDSTIEKLDYIDLDQQPIKSEEYAVQEQTTEGIPQDEQARNIQEMGEKVRLQDTTKEQIEEQKVTKEEVSKQEISGKEYLMTIDNQEDVTREEIKSVVDIEGGYKTKKGESLRQKVTKVVVDLLRGDNKREITSIEVLEEKVIDTISKKTNYNKKSVNDFLDGIDYDLIDELLKLEKEIPINRFLKKDLRKEIEYEKNISELEQKLRAVKDSKEQIVNKVNEIIGQIKQKYKNFNVNINADIVDELVRRLNENKPIRRIINRLHKSANQDVKSKISDKLNKVKELVRNKVFGGFNEVVEAFVNISFTTLEGDKFKEFIDILEEASKVRKKHTDKIPKNAYIVIDRILNFMNETGLIERNKELNDLVDSINESNFDEKREEIKEIITFGDVFKAIDIDAQKFILEFFDRIDSNTLKDLGEGALDRWKNAVKNLFFLNSGNSDFFDMLSTINAREAALKTKDIIIATAEAIIRDSAKRAGVEEYNEKPISELLKELKGKDYRSIKTSLSILKKWQAFRWDDVINGFLKQKNTQSIELLGLNMKELPLYNFILRNLSQADAKAMQSIDYIDKLRKIAELMEKRVPFAYNDFFEFKVALTLALIDRQFEHNVGKNDKVKRAAEYVVREVLEKSNYESGDIKIIQEIYNKLIEKFKKNITIDGKNYEIIDFESFIKNENFSSEEAKLFVEETDNIFKELLLPKLIFTNQFIRGEALEIYNKYTPLVVRMKEEINTEVDYFELVKNTKEQIVSTRSGASYLRTGETGPLRFDFVQNAIDVIGDVYFDRYLTPALRLFNKTHNELNNFIKKYVEENNIKENSHIYNQTLEEIIDAYKLMFNAVYANKKYELTSLGAILRGFAKKGAEMLLARIDKFFAETLSNISAVAIMNKDAFKHYDFATREKALSLMREVGSTHFERYRAGGAHAEFRIINTYKIAENKGRKDKERIVKVIKTYNNNPISNTFSKINDFLIKNPDKLLSIPYWYDNFLKFFREKTGEDFDIKMFEEDINYKVKYADAIKYATSMADFNTSVLFAPSSRLETLVAIAKMNKSLLSVIDNMFRNFNANEYRNLFLSLKTLTDDYSASLNKTDAAKLAAVTLLKQLTYQYAALAIYHGFNYLIATATDNEERKREIEKMLKDYFTPAGFATAIVSGMLSVGMGGMTFTQRMLMTIGFESFIHPMVRKALDMPPKEKPLMQGPITDPISAWQYSKFVGPLESYFGVIVAALDVLDRVAKDKDVPKERFYQIVVPIMHYLFALPAPGTIRKLTNEYTRQDKDYYTIVNVMYRAARENLSFDEAYRILSRKRLKTIDINEAKSDLLKAYVFTNLLEYKYDLLEDFNFKMMTSNYSTSKDKAVYLKYYIRDLMKKYPDREAEITELINILRGGEQYPFASDARSAIISKEVWEEYLNLNK